MKPMKKATNHRLAQAVALTLAASAVFTSNSLATPILTTNALIFAGGFAAPTGTFDLTNRGLIVYSISGATVADLMSVIGYSYNGGLFDLPGLTSSTALNDPNFATAIGTADNTIFGYTDFMGNLGVLDGSSADILSRYTYYGDADINGIVNGDDFDLFLLGKTGAETATWAFGDSNYDAVVNGDDFDLFLVGKASYDTNGQLNLVSAPKSSGVVPEPTSLALLALTALAATTIRFKKTTL